MKQTQIEVATKNSGATQATKVEITAIKDGKKPNRLFGFIKDKFKDRFGNLKNSIKGLPIGKESTGEKNKLEVGDGDILGDKNMVLLFIAFIESLTKKKIFVDDITKELHKNAKLTDEFKEAAVAEIQKRLGKNANLSKELITASLEKAINENPNLTQEQRDFYLSKLNDKDFMDKFYDILSIKDKEDIANKAKSSNELLALVNESFGNNFAKAKEKISKSQIDSSTMNSLDDTAMKSMSEDEVVSAFVENLKANEDLSKGASKARKQSEK